MDISLLQLFIEVIRIVCFNNQLVLINYRCLSVGGYTAISRPLHRSFGMNCCLYNFFCLIAFHIISFRLSMRVLWVVMQVSISTDFCWIVSFLFIVTDFSRNWSRIVLACLLTPVYEILNFLNCVHDCALKVRRKIEHPTRVAGSQKIVENFQKKIRKSSKCFHYLTVC